MDSVRKVQFLKEEGMKYIGKWKRSLKKAEKVRRSLKSEI